MERRALIAIALLTSAESAEISGASWGDTIVELKDYRCWWTCAELGIQEILTGVLELWLTIVDGDVEVDVRGLRV